MNKTSGYLVEYINKDNTIQKGIVRHIDQHIKLEQLGKVLIRLTNDDHTLKKDAEDNEITVLKSIALVKKTGFID